MIRLIAFLYRHPDLSSEEFADHWHNTHGPLIRNEPTLARHLIRYVQNDPLASGVLSGTALGGSLGIDGVAEQWFQSQEDFVAFVSEPAYAELIAPDEAKFLDQTRTQFLLTESHVEVIAEPTPTAAAFARESVAVITGGASGLGRDLAQHLINSGSIDAARLVIIDRNADAAITTANELNCHHRVINVADSTSLVGAIDEIWSTIGPITHLVNNAGVGNLKPFEQYSDDDLNLLWQVNVMGTYAAIRAAAPRMSPGSSILNIASVSGVRPTRGEAPYSAAKAAVVALTKAAALEFAPNVRVNSLSPGFIHTPLNDVIAQNGDLRRTVESGTPLGRLGQPADVSGAAAFLLSGSAGYITGQNLIIDGGSLLNSKQMDDVLSGLMGSRAE